MIEPVTSLDFAPFDPFEPLEAVPHAQYADWRASCPVPRLGIGWFLAKQADVSTAAKDVETFVASFREPGVVVPEEEKFINEIAEPRHGQIRKIINTAVAHHRAMHVEPIVRQLTEAYLEPMLRRGHGELIAELVAPVPVNVISHLIGVPPQDWEHFRRWSDEVVQGTYPTKYRNDRGVGLAGAHPEFTAYVDAIVAQRRTETDPTSRDDLVTRLIETVVDGYRLSDVEIRTQLIFLIISGNETTRHLIANLLATLATRPDVFAALQSDRGLIERAVEESLRHAPPIQLLLRNVMQPTDRFGVQMCPGEKVVYGIASANRDEAVFDRPDEFLLDRPNWRDHVAFGGGPHVCPGASLARLEARVVVDTVLDRVATITTEPGWIARKTPVFWANGPVDLPVRVTART